MGSRSGTQHMRIMWVTFCEPLAPFFDPARPRVLLLELILVERPEGSPATDHGARLDLSSILRANEFSSFRKANTSFYFPLYLKCSFINHNSFDEPTLLGVTMTENCTQRDGAHPVGRTPFLGQFQMAICCLSKVPARVVARPR